jgi:hypothetical protein
MLIAQNWSANARNAATLQDLEVVFARVVSTILGFAGIALFIMLLVGGFKFMTAGGDPKAAESAKKTLTFAVVGIVLVASSYLILRFINVFTGVDILNFRVFRNN